MAWGHFGDSLAALDGNMGPCKMYDFPLFFVGFSRVGGCLEGPGGYLGVHFGGLGVHIGRIEASGGTQEPPEGTRRHPG